MTRPRNVTSGGTLHRVAGRVALVLLIGVARSGNGQSVTIRGDATCAACRIEFTKAARLEAGAGSPFVSPDRVVRDARGNFYVADPRGARVVRKFDANGHPLHELSAPAGASSMIRALAVSAGDTVHVFTSLSQLVFGPDGAFRRSTPLPRGSSPFDAAALDDGRLVLQGMIGTAEMFGYPYHIFDRGGKPEKSFGAAPNAAADRSTFANLRPVARARSAGIWSGPMNRYELSLWSSDGESRRVITRDVAWFPTWLTWDGRFDVKPPPPRLMSLREDAGGRVWTLTWVAHRGWAPSQPSTTDHERPMATVAELRRSNDAVIEVIDPSSARVLASERFGHLFAALLDDGYVAELALDATGAVVVDVWQIALVHSPGGTHAKKTP